MLIALTILAALLIVALVVRERDHDRLQNALLRDQTQEREAAAIERSELLNRIQRPDLIPHARGPVRQTPAEDRKPPPELHKVGVVASIAAGEHSEDQE